MIIQYYKGTSFKKHKKTHIKQINELNKFKQACHRVNFRSFIV